MLDIPLFMGSGVLGSSSRRNSPQIIVKKPKGLWYWLVVAPIKYMMIFVFGMLAICLAISVGFMVFIPWAIIRALQHRSLKPDFATKIQEGKVVK